MAQTIAAPVGRPGGTNRPSDVKVVQELLNRVPSAAGGPCPLLTVDSICGPTTVEAIQNFQLKQLGWPMADGRVEPDGPTLEKLNELGGIAGSRHAKVLTTGSILRCPHGGVVCPTVQGRPAPTSDESPALQSTDRFDVLGCTLPTMACDRVRWLTASDPLEGSNIGICVSAAGVPLGKVVVILA